MPVLGPPPSIRDRVLRARPGPAVGQVVMDLAPLFPQPHNFFTSVGFGLRKQRLGIELAEFDLIHHLERGTPASEDLLRGVGRGLIAACGEDFPTGLPVDQPLLVDLMAFDELIEISATQDTPGHDAGGKTSPGAHEKPSSNRRNPI